MKHSIYYNSFLSSVIISLGMLVSRFSVRGVHAETREESDFLNEEEPERA